MLSPIARRSRPKYVIHAASFEQVFEQAASIACAVTVTGGKRIQQFDEVAEADGGTANGVPENVNDQTEVLAIHYQVCDGAFCCADGKSLDDCDVVGGQRASAVPYLRSL
ncbi:hypothetical protein [Subtercola boreus]|uniref:hypothetical protein n=1 Tax=Subtercola boreus TaxID=120213 RepID=UPI00209C0F4F|nr:hypothetical protein [Subtercola boreus]